MPRRLSAWVESSCRSKYAANAKSWIQHTMLKVSRLSWPYRLILHNGRLHSMKQCVLSDMLESWLHIMFPHLTGCTNVTFPIFISLSLFFSLSLSLSFSLLYSPCVLSIYSTTYMYHLKSSLQVIQSVVQSYDTLIKSVVSKHHQKYYWKLSTVPTYYLSTYYLLSKWS